jgi:hypothetical protein
MLQMKLFYMIVIVMDVIHTHVMLNTAVQYQIENGTKIFNMIHIDQIPHLLQIQVFFFL